MYLVLLALTALIAWVVANPPRFEEFVSMSVLSQNMTGTDYFSGNTSTVRVNEILSWNIQIYNHMGSTQLVRVNVKLSNETLPGPDSKTNSPSLGVTLLNTTRAVLRNETWNMPLQWSITMNHTQGAAIVIDRMQVNGLPTPPIGVSAAFGKNFRIIIELWTYDPQTHSFTFSFRSNGMTHSIWNQLWFNV